MTEPQPADSAPREAGAITLYDQARHALSEALRVDEVLNVRDTAERMKLYARQAKDSAMLADAMELKTRAERRLGELLIEAKETGQLSRGGRPSGDPGGESETSQRRGQVLASITLKEAGIDRNLSSKAQKLAEVDEAQFEEVVSAAREKILSTGLAIVNPHKDLKTAEKQVRRQIRELELAERQKALPDRRFGLILEDPEWDFETWSEAGKDRSAENHYPVSSLEALKARPVESIAAPDCIWACWTTVPMLVAAIELMASRGFTYKTHFIWDKQVAGTGYWNRNRHEILLIGVRGNVPAPAMGTQWPSLIAAPRGAHSEKPDWQYELLEDYFPNLPKIELNARRRRAGWDAWGLEAPEDETAPPSEGHEGQEEQERIPASEGGSEGSSSPLQRTSGVGAQPPDSLQVERESSPPAGTPSVAVVASESPPTSPGPGGMGDGEGGSRAALPDPSELTSEQKNQIIRDGYAVNTPLEQLAAATGLSRDAVKQRARTMKLGSRERQREMASAYTTEQHKRRGASS